MPTFTPELAVSWRLPLDPRVSPCGTRVAFTLADVSRPDRHARSSIWMYDLVANTSAAFSIGGGEDRDPRWSPDGTKLAFLSDRKVGGTLQLYVMPAGGGEAIEVARVDGGITAHEWSSDGSYLAFLGKDRLPDNRQSKPGNADQVVAEQDQLYSRLYVVPASGGEPRLVSPPGGFQVWYFDWAGDSRRLAAIVTSGTTENEIGYGPVELHVLDREDDTARRRVTTIDTGVEQCCWSPVKDEVAFRAKRGRTSVADAAWICELATGELRCVSPTYEGSLESLVWLPDGRHLIGVAVHDLWGELVRFNADGACSSDMFGTWKDRAATFDGVSCSRSGTHFATIRAASNEPPELWVSDNGSLRRATDLNPTLRAAQPVRGERIQWPSRDGMQISGLLFLPPGVAAPPLVLEIHGGPAWHWTDRFLGDWHDWTQLLVSRGFAVLMPNPRGSVGRGPEFADLEVGDLGGKEVDDLLTGVDFVVEQGLVDGARLGVGGWSHGGYLTALIIGLTDRFSAAVVGAGPSNLVSDEGLNDIPGFNVDYYDFSIYEDSTDYWRRSPLAHVSRAKTPTLIVHGAEDARVTQPQGQEFYRGLKHFKVPCEFVTYPREGHAIKERAHQLDLLERVLGWYHRYLRVPAPPAASDVALT